MPGQDVGELYADALREGREFAIRGVQRRNPSASTSSIFTVVFRCAPPCRSRVLTAAACLVCGHPLARPWPDPGGA